MESISGNVSGGMNLQKADGMDNTPFKKISLSKSDYRKLFSGLKSEIRNEEIDIREAKSGSGLASFLGKCWHWATSFFFTSSEYDLQSEIGKEYGFDIANALPEGKVSSGELERIKDILDRKIESFEAKTGRVFHKAENDEPAYWEESLSVRLDESEQRDDRFLEALRKAGDSEGLQILTGFDIIRVIEGEEELTFKGYYYKNIKIYPKVVDGILDGEKATVVLKRFSHGKQAHETLKLDIPCSSLPESVKTKLSCAWSTRQEILSKRGPFGLFAILQETDEADGATNEGLMNYKENPDRLLRDMHIKAETELYDILGAKTYLPFARVVDEKNKFPETPQEREKLVNEVFSELKMTSSKIFDKGFSDEEIKQLIDMEISRNNLGNGKSLCDNDFAYVAAELQRPVLLQVGTKDDPSYILFSPTYKGEYYGHRARDRYPLKAFQNSIHRFSKSELQDELCKDTEFLKSFKNAIFAEKIDDGQYINADQDLINSCQNMIAAGDVEAEKRAEVARKAKEAKKAEKEAEAKAKALPPHVKLTNAEWSNPAFREVLKSAVEKSAVEFQGLNVEGVIGKYVLLSKDGIQKGYSFENIKIYPNPEDDKGAIIVMERFSSSKGKNETLKLNVSRDALPKSIQSKLAKLA